MTDFRNLSVLRRLGLGRKEESERLDDFLNNLADPGLVSSLRRDEFRRRRLLIAGAFLVLGLLLGAGGVLLALRFWKPLGSIGKTAPAVARLDPHAAEEKAVLLVAHGRKLMRAKEIARALDYLELAAQLAPDSVEAWDALALAQIYGGQVNRAEESLHRCLKIDPEYLRAYHLLGDIGFYLGEDSSRYRGFWEKSDAKRALARLGLLENRLADVAPLIRRMDRENPDDRYVKIMMEAVRQGRLTPDLRLMLAPSYALSRDADVEAGWRFYFAQRYEEASAAFNRALTRNSRDASATIGRGWCLLHIGTPREAQSVFEEALALRPSNYSALNGLAWTRKAQGQLEGAVKLWQRVLELPHIDHIEIPESLKGLGMVYLERGDYTQANLYLARSFAMNPNDPETEKLLRDVAQRLSSP
ncbi:MAG: tetratricopeptide repeat protein [Thermoanaerobaculia bacterium]